MKQRIESLTSVHITLILGLLVLTTIFMLSGCTKPAEQPANTADTTDQTASDTSGQTSDETTDTTAEPATKMFDIQQAEMVGDKHVIGIVCEPDLADFTIEDLKREAERMVEEYKGMPTIQVNYYNAGEVPGKVEPTITFEWTERTGLVQTKG